MKIWVKVKSPKNLKNYFAQYEKETQRKAEAATQRCFLEKVFWKYTANLQENTHAEVRKLLCNFIEITLCHGCSPVNLLHIFRSPFLKEHLRWLLLEKQFLLTAVSASCSALNMIIVQKNFKSSRKFWKNSSMSNLSLVSVKFIFNVFELILIYFNIWIIIMKHHNF